jgi:hypothetical protein
MKISEPSQAPAGLPHGHAVELAPRGAYRFEVASGDQLRVVAGAVWLTETGAAADRLLTAGDAVLLRSSGLTWVEPCALSTLVVERLGSTYLQ